MSAVLVCALALAGCNLDQQGIDPTPGTLNFPIAVALSRAEPGVPSSTLFVANSNFDLRFNQGTLMAFNVDDLAGTEARTSMAIGGLLSTCTEEDPCTFTDLAQIEQDEVAIGSHADGLAVSPYGGRLYIAGRSQQSLSFVDWTGSSFSCGAMSADDGGPAVPVCSDAFLSAPKTDVAQRDLTLTGDPVAVTAGRMTDVGGTMQGSYVLLGLRSGSVALYVDLDDHVADEHAASPDVVPELVDIQTGFPPSLVTMTTQPGTGLTWTTSASTRELGRVGVFIEPDVTRSFVYDAGSVRIGGLDDGQDTRDLAFDPNAPLERAWVVERRPESVVTLDLTRMGLNAGDVGLGNIYEVGTGPSRIVTATIGGRLYLVVSCFDAKKLFVFDAEHGALVAVVGGISGPFEMAVDEPRQLLYVTDFSLSVVRIVDLEPLARSEAPFLLATLGEPTPIPTFAR